MALISSLKGKEGEDKPSKGPARTVDDGPPPAQNKPKPAEPKGSLFQQATNNLSGENAAGLGAEGGSIQVISNQALAQILTGVKTLSTVLPGLVPVLSDLTGRLTMLVPQMMNDMTNGGMGLVPPMGMPMPQPTAAPQMPGMGGPPGMPPPTPGGGGMMAGMGAPPMGGQPAPPMMPPM